MTTFKRIIKYIRRAMVIPEIPATHKPNITGTCQNINQRKKTVSFIVSSNNSHGT